MAQKQQYKACLAPEFFFPSFELRNVGPGPHFPLQKSDGVRLSDWSRETSLASIITVKPLTAGTELSQEPPENSNFAAGTPSDWLREKHLWLRPRGILNACDEASA